MNHLDEPVTPNWHATKKLVINKSPSLKPKITLKHFLIPCVAALLLTGCDDSGPAVHFNLPEGYRGVFQISVDKLNGVNLVKSNGIFEVIVSTNGYVFVKDTKFLTRWHKETASYPSGILVSREAHDTNAVVLRGLFADDQQTHWMLIGTERELQIATRITGQKLPMARRLTEEDLTR